MARVAKLLIGYDGSPSAEAMLDDLGRAGLPDALEALVITVGEDATALVRAADRLRERFPGWTVRTEVRPGSPARGLMDVADAWEPDLLVVGSHGRSMAGRLLLGSVSHKLVAEARCSVRVARRPLRPDDPGCRLVVGTDGSPNAEAAVAAVAARRWPPGSAVRVVHALWRDPEPGETDVEPHEHVALQAAERAAWREQRGRELATASCGPLAAAGLATSIVVRAEAAKRLLVEEATAWAADCVFVGATGAPTFDQRLLGGVATAVVMRAPCSVEVVRARAGA